MESYKEKYSGYSEICRFSHGNLLLLARPDNCESCGFEAVVLDFVSCPLGCDDVWNDGADFNLLVEVTARSDGIRHMWFSQGDDGYINYPNVMELSKIMIKLRELEEIYCREHEDS